MKLIVIKTFDDYITANLAMNILKEENIVCSLQDEYLTTTAPFLTSISGGIKLVVPEPQAELARKILDELKNKPDK